MPFDNVAKEAGLNAIAGDITVAGIHTADPGSAADNEVTGGDPAYSRQAISFSAASGDEILVDADVHFSGPPATAATWFTVWAGATRYGKGQIVSGDTAFNAAGEYTLKAGTRMRIIDPS